MHWPAEDLWLAMSPQLPGFSVEVLPTIDSTNSELMRRARAGQTDPVLLVAEQQTAGRGRLGRQWQSEAGNSLTFSLGLPLAPNDWSGLSLAIGWAIVNALDPLEQYGLGLKWPNDLWLMPRQAAQTHPRKLAGILVETAAPALAASMPPGIRYCVMGVGINLQTPPATDNPIAPVGLREFDPQATPANVLMRIAPDLMATALAFEQQGFAPFQALFNQKDVLYDLPVKLSDGQEGIGQGVNDKGELLIAQGNTVLRVHSAEVSVRPR